VHELADERVWLVGVHCSLEELERRERLRGDRQPGLAREQQATIHTGVIYDIEVDTTSSTPEACALMIKSQLQELGTPQALQALVSKLSLAGK